MNNSVQKKKARENLFYLSIGQGLSLILNLLSILLAARYLGVNEFGEFASVLAIVTILSKVIDFGLGPIVFRELSKESYSADILDNVFALKIILSIVVLISLNFFLLVLDFSETEIILSNILYVNIFISSRMANFREILVTPFKASLQMKLPMILNILDSSLLLIFVLLLPVFNGGLFLFVTAYTISNIPGFIFIIIILKKKFDYKFLFKINKIKWLIIESLPLTGFVLLMVLYQQVDIILLKYLRGSFDAGIYSAAARLTMPLNIIPATVVTTIFPIIVKKKDTAQSNNRIIILIFKILFFVSFMISILFSFKAAEFVSLLFGTQYIKSAYSAIILYWTQVFLFFNFFSLDLLTAYDKQKWNFLYGILLVIINLFLNFILIPKLTFVGAGYAKLFSGIAGVIFMLYILRRCKIPNKFYDYKMFLWIPIVLISTIILSSLPLTYYIISVLIIFTFLFFSQLVFSYEDLRLLFGTFNKENWIVRIYRKRAK